MTTVNVRERLLTIVPHQVHATVTLRGVRVTAHESNPPELVGRCFPWLEVRVDGEVCCPLDESGATLEHKHRRVIFRLQRGRLALETGRRAWRRAVRIASREGALYLTQDASGHRRVNRIVSWFGLLGAVAIPLLLWAQTGFAIPNPPSGQPLVLSIMVFVLLIGATSGVPLAVWLVSRQGRDDPVRVTLTSDGLLAEMADRSDRRGRWKDARSLRLARLGSRTALCFSDGTLVHIPPIRRLRMAVTVLVETHAPDALPPKNRQLRSMLKRCAVIWVIGHALVMAMVMSATVPPARGQALILALGHFVAMPLVIALAVWGELMGRRLERWLDRRQRRRRVMENSATEG